MTSKDIRWKQRFQNFRKSVDLLSLAMALENPDIIQKAGLIQFFEMSFELAWNLFKDYLGNQGFEELRSPRDSIKKAFEMGIITDGHLWLMALENRNKTSHTYDEVASDTIVKEIRDIYFPLLIETSVYFQNKI